MRKSFTIIALAALVMLASCKKNEQTTGTKLTAGIEQNKSNSKTSLNDLTITWSAGDQLYVNNGTAAACFTLTSNPGATSGEFATTGEYTFTDENVAVYPYNENITVGNNKVTMTLPAVQTTSTAGTFGNGANPMLGVFANPSSIQLTSLCGVLCLQLTGDNVEITDIKIEGGASDKLNGTFEADYTATSPVLAKTGDDGTNAVTLHLQETTTLTTTVQKFYVVLPAVTLTNGFTMKVYNGTNEIFRKSTANAITFQANYVETMTETPVTPSNKYSTPLTFEARKAGASVVVSYWGGDLEYSKNGGAWTEYTTGTGNITLDNVGDIVQFRGNNGGKPASFYNCTDSCYIYGNVMSLLHKDDYATNYTISDTWALDGLFQNNTKIDIHPEKEYVLPATTLTHCCYNGMFNGCTGLTRVPELPATTLAYGCYINMFYGCTNLTTVPDNLLPVMTLTEHCYDQMFMNSGLTVAPALPATTLATDCYLSMFRGCTSLTTAPAELPATTLANNCYNRMFQGCSSLTTVPTLPATTLVEGCYCWMFIDCTSLNSITCLATSGIDTNGSTSNWLQGVAATGTFNKASGVTWPINSVSGIPTGWTPVNYGAVLVENITLNKTETTLTVGETETLSVASVQPSNATDPTVTWSSDNLSVATVDATTGEVTAVAAGTATITATANDGSNVTATCAVTVNAPAPTVPTGAINGLFKVSATQQVYFSKGNLQYIGSAGTPYWKFADNQWDYLGTTTGQNSTNQNVDRDLFGWGTWTGSNPNPANTSINDSDYSWDNSDFIQTLSNGSGTWRTLTKAEWVYLFNTRESGATVTTTSGTTNDARYTQATINTDGTSVNGIILFPDGVTIASGEATSWGNINSASQWTEATKCTAAQWTDLANKGCVFLPAAGYRTNAAVFNLDTHGYYWSSTYHTPSSNEQQAWQLVFYKNYVQPEYGVGRHYGRSVRLVQDN